MPVPSSSLPVVDFSLTDKEAAAQLGKTCRTIGFFVIINHGIDESLFKQVFSVSNEFFTTVSQEEKEKHLIRSDNRGYSSFATEKLDPSSNQSDNKECFNVVPGEPGSFDDFRNPKSGVEGAADCKEFDFRWPLGPAELRTTSLRYIKEILEKVNDRLHRLIAIDLGLENPETFFRPFFEVPMATLRYLRYPGDKAQEHIDEKKEEKNQEEKEKEKQEGELRIAAGAHTDYDSVTYLVTDDVGGLQVIHRETGEWIDAPALPKLGSGIIVNIADCMMRWTNDIYKSTMHRVLQPKRPRLSVALFVGPHPSTKISALPGTGEAKYEEITAGEHLMQKLNATYDFRKQEK